jgi:predicted nucleotidyltransferase
MGSSHIRRQTSAALRPRNTGEVIGILRQQLPSLRAQYAIRSLALFGSYARGTARSHSDVDLLVEFEQTPSLFRFVELEQRLGDLLGVKVDLVMKDSLKPVIGQHILREQVPV